MSPCSVECSSTAKEAARSAFTRARPIKPLAPVTKTRSFIRQKLVFAGFELVNRLHVVIRAADVEPVPGVSLHVNTLTTTEQVEHQIVEAILCIWRNKIQDRAVQNIDSHADQICVFGLFAESGKPVTRVYMENAIIDTMRANCRSDREESATRHMLTVKCLKVE